MALKDLKKRREYARRYREKNRGKEQARKRRWCKNNAEHVSNYHQDNQETRNENSRRWRKEHPDERRKYERHYREKNIEKMRAKDQRRRARKASAVIGDTTELQAREAEIRKEACAHCGGRENIEVDHILPLAKGGAHTVDNLQPLCRSCNATKGDKILSCE